MSISSNSWFSSVYQTWLGTPMSQATWEDFLHDSNVQQLAANDIADYRQLYLQTFITTTFSQDPVVQALTQQVLPGATSEDTQALVKAFFELPQVTSLPGSATKQTYYSLYWAYLFEMTLLNGSDTEKWFKSTTEQFLGTAAADNLPQIITAFLATPAVQALPQSATVEDYQQLYVQYLSSSVNQAHISEMVTGQSPEAIQQTKVFWSIFELLEHMLDTMTVSQIRNAIAVQFLTKKRSVGAGAYDQVPVYEGTGAINPALASALSTYFQSYTPSSADSVFTPINVDLTDPSKFTLGYDNISLQDITDWVYSQAASSSTGQSSFSLYSGDYVTYHKSEVSGSIFNKDYYTYATQVLTLSVQNVNGSPTVTANLVQYSDTIQRNGANGDFLTTGLNAAGTIDWGSEIAAGHVTTTPIMSVALSPTTSDESSVKDSLNQSFSQLWSEATDAGYIEPTAENNHLSSYEQGCSTILQDYFLAARTPKIAWSPGILASSLTSSNKNLNLSLTKLVQDRSTENELISSQASTLSASLDVLKSLTDQQSQVQSASSSEEQMTVNVMQSTIMVMQQILSVLFA